MVTERGCNSVTAVKARYNQSMNTIDNRMEPSPQDFGFPANPTVSNTQVWTRQQAFLAAYDQRRRSYAVPGEMMLSQTRS